MRESLLHNPLFFITLTLVVYESFELIYRKSGRKLYLNPLLLASLTLILILISLHVSYANYFNGAQFIHLMLGPATVALAVPIYEQREKIKETLGPLLMSIAVASLTGMVTSVMVVLLWGGSLELATVMPKSITTPIAMGVSEKLGGIPEITAALVILTGIFGAAILPLVYRILPRRFQISNPAAQGLGLGASSHGVGMARAFQDGNISGTYAGLAIGLNGILTAFLAPLLMNFVKILYAHSH